MSPFLRLPLELLDKIFSDCFHRGWIDSREAIDGTLRLRLISSKDQYFLPCRT
jgi:hypothetical protein